MFLLGIIGILGGILLCQGIYWAWDKIDPIEEDRPRTRGNTQEPRVKEREDYWAA